MSGLHSDQPFGEIHVSHAFEFADATARNAATPSASDIGKIARQLDNDTFYILNDNSPLTWTQIDQVVGGNTVEVEYLKDVKANGTAGGDFNSGSYQTRDLNTQEGDSVIVSLSSNQFTLAIGTYEIFALAPAYDVDEAKAKIRNVTDAVDEIIGTTTRPESATNGQNNCFVMGRLTVSGGNKTFELQHRCTTTKLATGFGRAASFGDSEIYSIVKITKIS